MLEKTGFHLPGKKNYVWKKEFLYYNTDLLSIW